MVTSELKDSIVWLVVEGEMSFEGVMREAGKWLSQKDAFSGYVTDLRKMTSIPSSEEQKKLEEWRASNESGKPHALLGRTNALGVLVKMYISLTKARSTRYFMSPEAAVSWVKGYEQEY